MSRFAPIHTNTQDLQPGSYQYGFNSPTDFYAFISKPGLSSQVVDAISAHKAEPDWMRRFRQQSFQTFTQKPTPTWGGNLGNIEYDAIHYYLKPTNQESRTWDEVPSDIKTTFDRLGIPQAERDVLAGVKAQFDCLSGHQRILTLRGSIKIKDIKVSDTVYSLNVETKKIVKQSVRAIQKKGPRKVYKVSAAGRSLEVTANHPFLNIRRIKNSPNSRRKFVVNWRYLSDLKVGDYIAILVNFPITGKSYTFPHLPTLLTSNYKGKNQSKNFSVKTNNLFHRTQPGLKIPQKTSTELMWLLGLFIGDGTLTRSIKNQEKNVVDFAIPATATSTRRKLIKVAANIFGYTFDQYQHRNPDRMKLVSRPITQFLIKIGFEGQAKTKSLPEWLYTLPPEERYAFIAGYIDSDGTYIYQPELKDCTLTSANQPLLEQVQTFAVDAGLHTSNIFSFIANSFGGHHQGYRLIISGNLTPLAKYCIKLRKKNIKKNYYHKYHTAFKSPIKAHIGKDWGFARINSIEPLDTQEVYDIEVSQDHNFIAQGIIAHNSEVIYGSIKKMLADQGVVFMSMDEGLKHYPDLVRQYFGKLIPPGDNKFAALNSAVWSGGSFVYVPKNVTVKLPLQAYFRINAPNAGQFERTLIIADEGSRVHYVEGCFIAGTPINTANGRVNIEDMQIGDQVFSHTGKLQAVYHTQVRPYSGQLYNLQITGNPSEPIQVTAEHPILVVKRQKPNERNFIWNKQWMQVKDLKPHDYVCYPIDQTVISEAMITVTILDGTGGHKLKPINLKVSLSSELFRLIGYYLAEGSISSGHYLNFSFGSHEREYIEDVKALLKKVFNETRVHEAHHQANHGTSVVVRSTKLCRLFEQFAGSGAAGKTLASWILQAPKPYQQELMKGWFRGDGNYYQKQHAHGLKEVFRLSTISQDLAYQGRMILARLKIASGINKRNRHHEHRQDMYTLVIGGEYMALFGQIVGQTVKSELHHKKRATFYHLDDQYLYAPIHKINAKPVKDLPVYNFSVKTDESYTAAGIAVHNCTAPAYSSESLHSAVVEIYVKKGARVQYTTVQNWYKTVYNLVTKRARVEAEAEMVWTDFNMGSKLTMKYPSFILAGKGARGETLSMALAGAGQHQDTGSKATHLAPYTTSTIISKSISKSGGRTSYRGLVNIGPGAHHAKSKVVCDALILDPESRSDTYPTNRIFNSDVTLEHEATVSKIGEEQLFYLMSRGLTEEAAAKMIVSGFVAPLIKKLPLEYAVEMNRLIDMEMEGSVG